METQIVNATSARAQDLQAFLDALKAAFDAAGDAAPEVTHFRTQLFSALAQPGSGGTAAAETLPVCTHISAACNMGAAASPVLAALAGTFERLAPHLAWKVRPAGGPHASANWLAHHANAVIIGRGGLEGREDVAVGASLMAPHVRYPDHTHPPEELYMVLTPGRFQHGEDPWCEPGPGGTFHNPPGIKHAMASGDTPLLAFWTMINR